MRRPVRALVFDKDGTLFDFQASWGGWVRDVVARLADGDPGARAALAARLGVDPDTGRFARHSPVIAGTLETIVTAIRAVRPELEPDRLRRWLLEESTRVPQVPPVPLGPLLAGLRGRGLILGLATNDAEAAARAHLAAAGIADAFDFLAGYDSGFGAKPGAGMLRAFLGAHGLAPDEAAMIGDSTHDLVAARAAGMVAIGVETGPAERADLVPLADWVLPDIGALPDWLDGLSGDGPGPGGSAAPLSDRPAAPRS